MAATPPPPKADVSSAPSETTYVDPSHAPATLGEALGRAAPADPPGLTFEQTRIAGVLFGADAKTPLAVGRFRLLDRLGVGAMGVVYSAYDPELDRAVALKLVRTPDRGAESAVNEAKALARLSHPNVVPIHDVGVSGSYVYMVMELVRGETLGRWVEGRPLHDILDAYRQAGEALAAAHAAGLVHRDFKAANALVGTDGRVRVVDFGLAWQLARPAENGSPSIAGTPRYMAPEQASGAPITAAADQYSFCRALEEAIGRHAMSERPVPRWLQSVLDRGMADRPADRFASMRDLLRALSADPARVRRRRTAMVAAATALIAGAVILPRARVGSDEHRCGDGSEALESSWPAARQDRALARIKRMGTYGAQVAPLLVETLREHRMQWRGGYREACLARVSGAQSDSLVDQRMACLGRSRTVLASLAAMFETTAEEALPGLVLAVQALPSAAACSDLDALLSPVKPPSASQRQRVGDLRTALARGRLLIAAGHFLEATDLAHGVVSEARSLGYRPVLAESLLVEGQAQMALDRDGSIAALNEATQVGLEVGADALAAEAWARRAWREGTSGDHPGNLAGLDVIQRLVERMPSARFERALLYNNTGGVEVAMEQRARARRSFERALREAQGVTGPGSLELLNVRVNLALNSDDPAVRDELFAQGIGEMARRLGTDHPQTLANQYYRGVAENDLGRAQDILATTCRAMDRHPAVSSQRALCWKELAMVRDALADNRGAVEAMTLAWNATSPGEKADAYRGLEPYLLLWKGDATGAARLFRAALVAWPPLPDEFWWRRFRRAETELGLGRACRALGDLEGARNALESSLKLLVPLVERQPRADLERRLGRARIELSHVLVAAGETRAARDSATRALDWLRRVQGSPVEIAQLARVSP